MANRQIGIIKTNGVYFIPMHHRDKTPTSHNEKWGLDFTPYQPLDLRIIPWA